MSSYYHPKPLSLMAQQSMDAAKIRRARPSPVIASLKASLALNIRDKPILDYGAAVFHQEARELEDTSYWYNLTGGDSDSWPECPQEGKR